MSHPWIMPGSTSPRGKRTQNGKEFVQEVINNICWCACTYRGHETEHGEQKEDNKQRGILCMDTAVSFFSVWWGRIAVGCLQGRFSDTKTIIKSAVIAQQTKLGTGASGDRRSYAGRQETKKKNTAG